MWVFFPPRLIKLRRLKDSQRKLEKAVEEYQDQGLVIICNEESMKDCQKMIAYAQGFPQVTDPEWEGE